MVLSEGVKCAMTLQEGELGPPFKQSPIASRSIIPADCVGSSVQRQQLGYQRTEPLSVNLIRSSREMDIVGREQFLVQPSRCDGELFEVRTD